MLPRDSLVLLLPIIPQWLLLQQGRCKKIIHDDYLSMLKITDLFVLVFTEEEGHSEETTGRGDRSRMGECQSGMGFTHLVRIYLLTRH